MRRSTAILLLVVATVLAGCGGEAPPNVVLVVLDTVRDDHTGLEGRDRPSRTPVLDQVATDATVFSHAFANAPWTPPSHTFDKAICCPSSSIISGTASSPT